MQVIELDGVFAWCDSRNGRSRINTMLVGDVVPGQWLLTFLDAARETIDEERAMLINAALDGLQLAASGSHDLDACFADLVNREPQLPDFLRKEH
jgi:hydrogenase assembly chaperone HypC/HupF